MKALITAAGVALIAAAAPGLAQAQTAVYGGIGYAHTDVEGADLGAIQGRLGAKFTPNLGIEGELAGGVADDTVTVLGAPVNVELKHQAAVYGVGFLPVAPNIDLIARVGYGTSKVKASSGGVAASADGESFNYGVGAQWFADEKNGVRADYTRHDFTDDGGEADVWSLGYVRKF
jgi:hypothetical protein